MLQRQFRNFTHKTGFMPVCTARTLQSLSELTRSAEDIKPDNVLVDWESDSEGNKTVTNVALGDFDIACKLKEGETRLTPHAVGNAMWRSPEAQTGISTRASDVYSLGLVVRASRLAKQPPSSDHESQYIYTLGAGELLVLRNYQDLVKAGITPEQEIITKHFCYFGPVPESLYQQIRDENWRTALRSASEMAEAEVKERPILRFRLWGQELGDSAMELLSGMTNLDPKARLTMDQVLALEYWRELNP